MVWENNKEILAILGINRYCIFPSPKIKDVNNFGFS